MCIDGDNAGHVSEYINAQLQTLHRIALECINHYEELHEHGGEDPAHLPGYDFALAAFYHHHETPLNSSKFAARFGPPVVDFVCNHDAFLHINVYQAALTTSRKAAGGSIFRKGNNAAPPADVPSENYAFAGVLSFRVPFIPFNLEGKVPIGGHASHSIDTYILDIPRAYVVPTVATSTELQENFKPLLDAYLKHFQKSGFHILHSLPAFDDNRFHRGVDFSAVTRHSYDHVKEMYNIAHHKIVTYIKEAWQDAAWFVQEETVTLGTRDNVAIRKWDSTWSITTEEEYHFQVRFGAPEVVLLCEHEAIIYIHVSEVVFSDSTTFHPKLPVHRDWKIPIVVNVHHTTEEDGAVQILSIDTKHGGKFTQALSEYFGFDLDLDANFHKFTRLVTFLTTEYLHILQAGGFHLYRWDSRASARGGRGGSTGIWHERYGGDEWSTDVVSNTDMRGFQQIIVLSQASLDEIFHAYYTKYNWMQRDRIAKAFEFEYGALKVRLLSNSRALVFITIKSGKLRTVRNGKPADDSEEHQIGEWELCFDVGIKFSEIDSVDAEYKESDAYKLSQTWKETKLKQLSLDFTTEKFYFQLSRFNDAAFGYTDLSIQKVSAAIHYIRKYYFRNLTSTTARVLHTITISRDLSENRPRYAFADAAFHIYSKTTVTYANYNILKPGEEPVIVILGMTSPHLHPPSTILRWSSGWLQGSQLGTIALSSDIFLHGRLLPLLEGINRATTLMPASLDMDAGNWRVQLTTWKEKYANTKDRLASWEELPKSAHAFEYKWDYTDEYEYNHEGRASDNATGTNFLSMKTDNRLTIPTTFRAGQLDIKAHGTTTFAIGWKRADEDVRLSATASWTVIISAITGPEGLKISIAQDFSRNISEESVTGEFIQNDKNKLLRPKTMLERSFPEKISLDAEVHALKTFEGVWSCIYPGLSSYKLGNPFFTTRGDLLVELCPDVPAGAPPAPRPNLPKPRSSIANISRPRRQKSSPNSPLTPFSAIPGQPSGFSPGQGLPPSGFPPQNVGYQPPPGQGAFPPQPSFDPRFGPLPGSGGFGSQSGFGGFGGGFGSQQGSGSQQQGSSWQQESFTYQEGGFQPQQGGDPTQHFQPPLQPPTSKGGSAPNPTNQGGTDSSPNDAQPPTDWIGTGNGHANDGSNGSANHGNGNGTHEKKHPNGSSAGDNKQHSDAPINPVKGPGGADPANLPLPEETPA